MSSQHILLRMHNLGCLLLYCLHHMGVAVACGCGTNTCTQQQTKQGLGQASEVQLHR